MKIILLVENSIHEVTYPAGSELEVADFEGEFLISHNRAKRMEGKRKKTGKKNTKVDK